YDLLQFFGGKRFVNKAFYFLNIVGAALLIGVQAGGQNQYFGINGKLLRQFLVFFQKLPAIHAGHVQVQENKVRVAGGAAGGKFPGLGNIVQRFLPVGSHLHFYVQVGLANCACVQEIGGFIVVHQQNAI